MPKRLRHFVAWTTLAQVALVGGLGTGLHGLLGCEHRGCAAFGCVGSPDPAIRCETCAFCRHAAQKRADSSTGEETTRQTEPSEPIGIGGHPAAVIAAAGCDGCAVCDLLAQYHTAAPFGLQPPAIEPASTEAAVRRHNAIVAAAKRLALSRGPPAA